MAWASCAFSHVVGAGTGHGVPVAQAVAPASPAASLATVVSKASPLPAIAILFVLVALVVAVALVVSSRRGSASGRARRSTGIRTRPTPRPRGGDVPATIAPPDVAPPVAPRSGGVPDESRGLVEAGQAPARVAPAPSATVAPTGHPSRRYLYHASYSDRGGREVNEDAVGIRELDAFGRESLCVVVADGLGGHGHGEMASRAAAQAILDCWDPAGEEDDLAAAFEAAHQAVRGLQSPAADMRTTAVALSLARGRAVWANVGDSRLYHFNNGTLAFQSIDHSVSQLAVALGQISPDEIRGHEDRARLVKALGQADALNPDVGEIALARTDEDAFLLCTDGFWEYVLEDEMEETLHGATSPDMWLDRMRSLRDRRAPADCDNNSAAVVWVCARKAEGV